MPTWTGCEIEDVDHVMPAPGDTVRGVETRAQAVWAVDVWLLA